VQKATPCVTALLRTNDSSRAICFGKLSIFFASAKETKLLSSKTVEASGSITAIRAGIDEVAVYVLKRDASVHELGYEFNPKP